MNLDDISKLLEFALLLSAVFAAYKTPRVLRWMNAKRKGLLASLRAIGELADMMPHLHKLQGMDATLGTIRAQVMPNGGSSLSDKVHQTLEVSQSTARNVTVLAATVRAHHDADANVAKFEADSNGLFTWVSKSFLRWCNRSPEQMRGWGWSNCVADKDRDRVREEWEMAVNERREFQLRFELRDNDGCNIAVEANATPIFYGAGAAPEQWVGVIRRVAPPV